MDDIRVLDLKANNPKQYISHPEEEPTGIKHTMNSMCAGITKHRLFDMLKQKEEKMKNF